MNDELRSQMLQLMNRADYLPQNKSELARNLGIHGKGRSELRALIDQLEEEGVIACGPKGRYRLRKEKKISISGYVKKLRSGRCLLIPDSHNPVLQEMDWWRCKKPEFLILPHRLQTAMDGDHVVVVVDQPSPASRWIKATRRHESHHVDHLYVRVERILERRDAQWIGIFKESPGSWGQVVGDGILAPELIELDRKPTPMPEPGMIVSVEPLVWPNSRSSARGAIREILGFPEDPHVDMELIIRKYNLPRCFPDDVLLEAEALSGDIASEWLRGREDWTNRLVVTIDPEDARDFDDAIGVSLLEDGIWEAAVHIADVSFYVRPGMPLDEEAIRRGNSTYLPDRVIPMLPPRLCDDICSLKPGVIRLTKVCVMRFRRDGSPIGARFADAYIRSARRLTYAQAANVLHAPADTDLARMLHEAWRLTQTLRNRRLAHGSLELDVPEVRVVLDNEGRVERVVSEKEDESHHLIEELMIAANEAVAHTLKTHQISAIYRVHENPDPAKLDEFGEICRSCGYVVHDVTLREEQKRLLAAFRGTPEEFMLKSAFLKSLMRARYDVAPLGHYGLAKSDYCHFTSPIRRYADLVVHRALSSLIPPHRCVQPDSSGRLQEIAEYLSETERVSALAEREAHQMKLMEWLENQAVSESPVPHRAVIREVQPFGLFVEVPALQLKGMIRTDELQHWAHPGMVVPVIPVSVNREEQWVDWELAPHRDDSHNK